jgi:ParB family chromosome partitioning protein
VGSGRKRDARPYEEAEGFQRLLDISGYDVATLVEKSGKSASHIYARLSLLQLIPGVAEAFTQERITVSHANLIARIPQEAQAGAFEQCWRKDWQDSEPHLLPAKHISAWIQNNLISHLTASRSLVGLVGPNPRVIADDIWAKLVSGRSEHHRLGRARKTSYK